MKFAALVVVVLALAVPAHAQSLRALSQQKLEPGKSPDAQAVAAQRARDHADLDALNTASWVYIGTAAADWSVTAVCAKVLCGDRTQTGFLYGVEKPAAAIPIGLAIDAAVLIGVREWLAPDHPKIARALLYGLSGVRVVFVANKVNDLREHVHR